MTKEEFDELKAAIEAVSAQDAHLARVLTNFLMLLVRALPVTAEEASA